MYYTHIIIAITAIISFWAWSNGEVMFKSFFIPTHIKERKEYWRFFTHGFVHADQMHLIFNMLALYFFGPSVEVAFAVYFGSSKIFVLFYFVALIASSIPSYYKHRNNYRYRALGASGAVSAVIFAAIIFDPWRRIGLLFLPDSLSIPGILFGVLYIWYSAYMSKQNRDNIGHDAHLWGAVFGFIFPFIIEPRLFQVFINNLSNVPYFQ